VKLPSPPCPISDHLREPCPRGSAPVPALAMPRDGAPPAVCPVALSRFLQPENSADFNAKVPAPAEVQSVEAILAESLRRFALPFSTAFSTSMLKTSAGQMQLRRSSQQTSAQQKSRPNERLLNCSRTGEVYPATSSSSFWSMSKLAFTFCTSSCSSRASISRIIVFAAAPSSLI
jgi:hypothetical protein